jgi:hypothetical protein
MDYWYIYNRKNNLFWNNEAGWGHLATATRFTEREKETFNLPLDGGMDARNLPRSADMERP